MSSLHKAIPSPVRVEVGKGQTLTFNRIGLDIWSEFCEYVLDRRTHRVSNLSLNDDAKAGLYKDLVGNGISMEEMLEEASTTDGMRWIICRCCESDVSNEELAQLISLSRIPALFQKLADMESKAADEDQESDPKKEKPTGVQ
jgi:hypothetical protein